MITTHLSTENFSSGLLPKNVRRGKNMLNNNFTYYFMGLKPGLSQYGKNADKCCLR
jgi:hypothetical protein